MTTGIQNGKPKTTPGRSLTFDEVEQMLISFSASVLQQETTEDVYWSLAKNVISKLGFVDCVIYSANLKTRSLVQRAAYGPKSPLQRVLLRPLTIPFGSGITGSVAVTGVAERIADTSQDVRYIVDDEVRHSELTVPIKHQEKIIGIIDCEHPEKDFFTEQHLRILNAVASLCAVKLSHIEVQEAVRKKERKLLEAQRQMAEMKIRAIAAQLNPHFVFNALNAVQHFITLNDKKGALRFLSAFSKLVRLYLKHLENDIINLVQEIAIIEQYLKLQRLRYDGSFDFKIVYRGIEDENTRVPALVTQLIIEEAVENLAKNKVGGQLIIGIKRRSDKFVDLSIDIAITKKDIEKGELENRYANEFTDWNDHVRLLRKVKGFKIEIKRQIIHKDGIVHHIHLLSLPCL
jgi:putative methionine-R-sulfoxide reductase with GAF domain